MSSDLELNQVGILRRREIEARILAPVLEAIGEVFGKEAVLEITRRTIEDLARQQGRELAGQLGAQDLNSFAQALEPWSRSGALELQILNQNPTQFDFDVTRCKYAELYRELGVTELGAILSCSRDAAFIEGFNTAIRLERSQTILGGAAHCDFRYSGQSEPE
jgi:hypothetical protein